MGLILGWPHANFLYTSVASVSHTIYGFPLSCFCAYILRWTCTDLIIFYIYVYMWVRLTGSADCTACNVQQATAAAATGSGSLASWRLTPHSPSLSVSIRPTLLTPPLPSPLPILSSHFYAIYTIPITFWLSHILWEQWNCRLDLVCKKLANLPHIRILLNFPHIESTKTIKGKQNNLDIYRLLYRLKVIVQKFLEVKTDNFPLFLSPLYLNWVDVDSVSITRKG